MRKLLSLVFGALLVVSAHAQSVQQSGSVTATHVPAWVFNGIIGDGGTASDSPITTLGVTSNSTAGFCVSSGRSTAAGRQQLCLGAPLASSAVISLQNYGTATAQDLSFVINGTTVTIPTGGGDTVATITTPTVADSPICAADTSGTLEDCTTGTTGQVWLGQTGAVPTWNTLSGDIASVSAAGAVTVGGVNGVTYPASPSVGTAPYVSSSNTITYGVIPPSAGGTGVAGPTANGVLIAQGSGAMTTASTSSIGLCLLSNGAGSDPSFQSCASGAGSAAGSDTQVQFNNSTALAGSANLTWVSPALTIGVNATTTGQLVLANGDALGTSVTVQNNTTTSAYNFNLPNSAGTSGQPLLSGGGGVTPMTFGTLGVAAGGTNCNSASGTCIDNISGWSSTGFINRTGAATYAFTSTIGLINGGTGANLTASDGGIVYSDSSAMAILAGTATANQIVLSGSNTAPAWSTATYPATTTANQLLYSSSTNTVAGLATGNDGVLITSGAGVPSISSTLPSAVQGNITAVGTVASGAWNGDVIALAYGGTNANLTADNGGIFYSTATAGAILSGTATASLPLLSGTSGAPSWAAITYPASATSGGIPYFSSATAMASSAALGSGQLVVGGGAGAAPSSSANASLSSGALTLGQTGSVAGSVVLSGSTSGTATLRVAAAAGTATIFELPATNGTSGYVLRTDGAGVTSWVNPTSGGTVTAITCDSTLSCTSTNPITTSGTIALSSARQTLPTTQTFTSGSGTYTTPANVLWIEIYLVGAGGGGGGSGTTTTGGAGGAGGATCWNTSGGACTSPVYSAGGGGGALSAPYTGGTAGAVTGSGSCAIPIPGVYGSNPPASNASDAAGGDGASSFFGGRGRGGERGVNAGMAGTSNTGGGGGGASSSGSAINPGGGGGSGAYCYAIINSPAASYTYAVGAAGTAGTAGTSGAAGGAGGSGYIKIIEHYGS